MKKPWAVWLCMHVVPVDDKLVHKFAEDCLCKPRTEDHPSGKGWIIIHNAMDRRANWAPAVIEGGKTTEETK